MSAILTNPLLSNRQNVIRCEFIFVTTVFLISPFLCFPFLLIGAYNRRKYAFAYISIFLGLLSMYYYPQGDQYRYLEDIISYRNLRLSELFNFEAVITYRNFNLITLSLFVASKIHFITLELYRFIIVSAGCSIILYLYALHSTRLKLGRAFQFRLFLIILLSIPIYYMSQGFRSGFGAVFVCAGLYMCLHSKKIGYLLILIASFIHFVYFPLSILYILAMKCRIRINNRNILIFIIAIVSLISTGLYLLYGRVPFITMLLDIYVFGDYGSEFVWNAYRLKEVILINGLPTFLLYILFLLSKKDKVDYRFSNILYINLVLLIISLPFQTFIQRLGIISVLLLAFYCLMYFHSMKMQKYSQIVILTLSISMMYPFFMHRYCYYHSNVENFFIYPLPLIMQNTYDITEVNKLLDDNGVLKSQYLK